MRAVIILIQKLLEERGQFLVVLPRFVSQPLFERAHKSLSDTVRLRPMASDEDWMNS
jgi:hypothetical protein